ncbi:MAG: nitroreductase family protein [Armatimonadetes bacterium]|nr:nitroreductase family protein [Armatimonadota bacterium]
MEKTTFILPIIEKRWSPRAFDPNRPVDPESLATLFEAARWAPSTGNEQPWRFIVGVNFDQCHKDIFSTLAEGNQRWAMNAPVLLIGVAKLVRNDRPNRLALHDLGLATENLFLQAYDLDLYCHFMGGFSADKAREIFGIPSDYEPVTAAAIGYPGDLDALPDDLKEREEAPRQRKSLEELVFTGQWENPLSLPGNYK